MKTVLKVLAGLVVLGGVACAGLTYLRRRSKDEYDDEIEAHIQGMSELTRKDAAVDQQMGDYNGSSQHDTQESHAHFAAQ